MIQLDVTENFFVGWRVEHDLTGTWRAESPDWGINVEAKTLWGLTQKMKRAEAEWRKANP